MPLTTTNCNTLTLDGGLHPTQALELQHHLDKTRPLYFVGIGGAGMSPLALAFAKQGFTVSGADLKASPTTADLQRAGIQVFVGHAATQVPSQAVLVISTAINLQNPEVQLAQQAGYPILHRSQLLQALMHTPSVAHAIGVGLSGTHGKTTLTGMANSVLSLAGLDPTVIAGGILPDCGRNIRLSQQPNILVAELDESDGTILRYAPTFTILSNLELDHADHYQQGEAGLQATFEQFCGQLNLAPVTTQFPNRTLILNASCRLTKQVVAHLPANDVTALWLCPDEQTVPPAGVAPSQVFTLKNIRSGMFGSATGELYQADTCLGTISLAVPGIHNLHNAAQIAILAHAMGVEFATIQAGLLAFTGMGRRFEQVGTLNGALLIDDYAHHPTEVKATIQAAQAALASQATQIGQTGRLMVLFQPHRYTRLQALWEDFTTCFDALTTELLLLEVYAAHEQPIAGITAQHLAEALTQRGIKATACATIAEAQAWLSTQELTTADLVLSMGAGDITTLLRTHPNRQALHGN
jgi:UDP-N-acetylmuramate--alanine ligase